MRVRGVACGPGRVVFGACFLLASWSVKASMWRASKCALCCGYTATHAPGASSYSQQASMCCSVRPASSAHASTCHPPPPTGAPSTTQPAARCASHRPAAAAARVTGTGGAAAAAGAAAGAGAAPAAGAGAGAAAPLPSLAAAPLAGGRLAARLHPACWQNPACGCAADHHSRLAQVCRPCGQVAAASLACGPMPLLGQPGSIACSTRGSCGMVMAQRAWLRSWQPAPPCTLYCLLMPACDVSPCRRARSASPAGDAGHDDRWQMS